MKKKKKAAVRPVAKKKLKVRKTGGAGALKGTGGSVSSDAARINLVAGDNFYDIARVKAEGREEGLKKAIGAYKKALKFYTLRDHPYDYAVVQNNIANAYFSLSGVRDRGKNIALAIRAYNESLRVRTPDTFPADYAATQNCLGTAYGSLAEESDGDENLELAFRAFSEALRVRTVDAFPVDYAETRFNLGHLHLSAAKMHLENGNRRRGMESFKAAEAAFAESCELFGRGGVMDWADRAKKHLADVRKFIKQMRA